MVMKRTNAVAVSIHAESPEFVAAAAAEVTTSASSARQVAVVPRKRRVAGRNLRRGVSGFMESGLSESEIGRSYERWRRFAKNKHTVKSEI